MLKRSRVSSQNDNKERAERVNYDSGCALSQAKRVPDG